MVFMIIIPIKWLFYWRYTLFADKPMCAFGKESMAFSRENLEATAAEGENDDALEERSVHYTYISLQKADG